MKSAAMRKINLFSAVLSLFLLVSASITWAQTITSQKGLTTTEFNLPQGKIKIYLPQDIRSGDQISGSIVAEPFGDKPKTILKNAAELNKVTVQIDTKRYSPAEATPKPFTFTATLPIKRVQIFSGNNKLLHDVQTSGPGTAPYQPADNLAATPYCVPSHSLTGSPFQIKQIFDGDISNTKIFVGDNEATILAESPRSCIAAFPEYYNGPQPVKVLEKGENKCSGQSNAVRMDLSAPKTNLRKGEKTTIRVTISGLDGIRDTAALTLKNITPGIVTMLPSDIVVIFLSPDSAGTGTFNRQFDIRSIATGDFVVQANLDLPDDYGQPAGQYDIPKTSGENKTDTIPCKELEELLKKLEDQLQGLKDELAAIDGQIRNAKLALIDCNEALKAALADYHAAKKEFDKQAERKHNYEINKQSMPPAAQKEYEDAKKAKDDAAKKWSDQNKKCKDLEQKIAGLEARKTALPGLIKSLEDDIGKLKTEIEKCKQKEAEEKRKTEEEIKKAEAAAAAKTAAEKADADARRERIETNRYLLQNIYSLGLISSKEFWETPGITSWLPEVLEKPLGDIAEEVGKTTIPVDALPALAGVYQVAGMLLDPCTADGSRKTIERLKKMINTRTGAIYTDEQALDKTEKMCEMLKKIKALSAAAGKK